MIRIRTYMSKMLVMIGRSNFTLVQIQDKSFYMYSFSFQLQIMVTIGNLLADPKYPEKLILQKVFYMLT